MKTDKSNPLTTSILDLSVANISKEVPSTSELFVLDANEQPNLLELERKQKQEEANTKIEQDKLNTKRHNEIRNIAFRSLIVAIISVIIAITALIYTICYNT